MNGLTFATRAAHASAIRTIRDIRPKKTSEFLKRFHVVERFLRRSNMLFGIPPLIVPQVFLEKPSGEILHQLSSLYANELNYYHIRLLP